MGTSNITLMLILTFTHYLATGIVVPVITHHIHKMGGTQIAVGGLQTIRFVVLKISLEFLRLFEHGKKFALALSLYSCTLYFLLLINLTSWKLICLIRLAHALTTHVSTYAKEFIQKMAAPAKVKKLCNWVEVLRVFGLSCGSIIGGFVFDCFRLFSYNAIVASCLSIVTIVIVHCIDNEDEIQTVKSKICQFPKTWLTEFYHFLKTGIKDRRNDISLILTYNCIFAIYLSRLAFILWYNYPMNSTLVGTTRAYYYMIMFLSSCTVPFFIQYFNQTKKLVENAMLITCVSIYALSFAPTYWCYLICYIPMLFTYNLVMALLHEDPFGMKCDMDVYRSFRVLQTFVQMFTPFWFGFVRHYFRGRGSKLGALIPVTICMIKIHWRWFHKEELKTDRD